MNTKSIYFFFPPYFMASNRNFIKFIFKNMIETDQEIELTEISELIELFGFIQPQETTDPLWGRGYNLYIHLCMLPFSLRFY